MITTPNPASWQDSTIVEGVNTKARNMVILNHTKGQESLPQLLSLDISQAKTIYLMHKDAIYRLLDNYEKRLMARAVESMLRK